MKSRRAGVWGGGLFGPAMLAWESQQVIALRLAKMALGGPAAALEAQRMVAEKFEAAANAATLMAASNGDPAAASEAVTRMLRRRVRANRKRLGGG